MKRFGWHIPTKKMSIGIVALLLCSCWAGVAAGQDQGQPPPVGDPLGNDQEDLVTTSIRPHGRFTFDSGLEKGNGDFSVWRLGVDLDASFELSDDSQLQFRFGYEYNNYDFDAPNVFLATTSDPFDDIHIIDLGLTYLEARDDLWSWYVGADGQFSGDADADVADLASIGGRLGVGYQFTDTFDASLGILVRSQIEDDPLVVPLIGINWQIDDRWRLEFRGVRGLLSYDMGDGYSLGFGAAWEYRRFRLDDDPIAREAVVQDTTVPIFAQFTYQPDDTLEITLTGGVIAFQEFRIEDRNGNFRRDFEGDPTGFIGAGVRVRF